MSVLKPPVEPPASLLYKEQEPIPDLDESTATVDDLVKRIHELTARLTNSIVEHRGLSRFVVDEYQRYKQFYDEQQEK